MQKTGTGVVDATAETKGKKEKEGEKVPQCILGQVRVRMQEHDSMLFELVHQSFDWANRPVVSLIKGALFSLVLWAGHSSHSGRS
jgi:hypothetical protein